MANPSNTQPLLPGHSVLADTPPYLSPPIEGSAQQLEPGLVFYELAHCGKLNLRGTTALAAPVKTAIGCDFPPAANRFNAAGERRLVWLGPDEYLLLCEAGKELGLRESLAGMLADKSATVNNVTDALCALMLTGPAVRTVLAKGCSLDLHPTEFSQGACAQTLLAHAAVTILAVQDNNFMVLCRSSFAPYLHQWLKDAALEFGVKFST